MAPLKTCRKCGAITNTEALKNNQVSLLRRLRSFCPLHNVRLKQSSTGFRNDRLGLVMEFIEWHCPEPLCTYYIEISEVHVPKEMPTEAA